MDECIINVWGYTEILPPFQLTVMQAAKRRRDVTEDSDKEGNFYG